MNTIFLRKESREYTKLPNELLRRRGMSGLAKAILCMMLSHKDGWLMTMARIEECFKDGKKAIRHAIHDLEESGHAVRERVYDHKKKRPDGIVWRWYSHPDLTKEYPKRKKKSKVPLVKRDSSDISLKEHVTQGNNKRITNSKEGLLLKEDVVLKEEVARVNGSKSKASLAYAKSLMPDALESAPSLTW